jgi:hypothetical protein
MEKIVFFVILVMPLFSQGVLAATVEEIKHPLVTSSGSLTCDQYCINNYRASDAACCWWIFCPGGYEDTGKSLGCGWPNTCHCKRGDKPPSVSISHSPETVREGTIVIYTATATDDYNLKSIEIFVDGKNITKCYVSGTSSSCVATGGPYPVGSNHSYYAVVSDDANQMTTSEIKSFAVFYAPGGTCVRANPNLWIEPTYQSASAGTKVTYTLRIKNNDNNYCNASRFYIFMSGYPSNWNFSLEKNFVSIQPGSEAVTYLFVTSSPTTSPQNYSFGIIVKNYEAAQYTTTSVATYEVKPSRAPPTVYGNYTIYPKSGVTDGWISLEIRDREGKTIDTLIISKGSKVDSIAAGISIKVISVTAEPDGTVTDYKLEIYPLSPITTSTTTTTLPSCSGLISLSLSPNPAPPSASVTATISGLRNCDGKTVKVYLLPKGQEMMIAYSCIISGSGCSCTFNAPSNAGNYTYRATLDINDDGVEDIFGTSVLAVITVSTTTTIKPTTTTTTTSSTTTTTSSTTTTTIKTTTTTIPPTTTPTQPTTSTTPPYTPCSSGYSCVPSSGISSFCYGCGQNRMSCDCKPQSTPCNQVGSNYCCKCISTPIPAGIFDSLWNFIKSLLGIK